MFDDSKEPTDIFAGVDPVAPSSGAAKSIFDSTGIAGGGRVTRSGPPRWLFIIVAVLALGGLGGGGYYFFVLRGGEPSATEQPALPANIAQPEPADSAAPEAPAMPEVGTSSEGPPTMPDVDASAVESGEPVTLPDDEPATVSGSPTGTEIPSALTPPSTDSDGDGLTDEEEAALATDTVSPDTDADGLNDGEEVNIYVTDPLKPDTDGDTFLDGQEVKGGYNPKGEGRLLDLPPTQ